MKIRKKYNISDDEKVIGFMGLLCKRKNPQFALEIFKEYNCINPKSKMIFVGGGNIDEIKKLTEEYKLSNKVIFTGMVSDAYRWYQAFDFFLLPSLYEGFPVVLVEAQTNGIRSLVSDTITKQVRVTDLIEYMSLDCLPNIWAKKIDELINTDIKREAYKQRMAELGFDVNSMANEVKKLYMK